MLIEHRVIAIVAGSMPKPFESLKGYEGELRQVEAPGARRVNRFWQDFVGNPNGIKGDQQKWNRRGITAERQNQRNRDIRKGIIQPK